MPGKFFLVHVVVVVLIMLTIAFLSNLAESNASWCVSRSRSGSNDTINDSGPGLPPVANAGPDLTIQINEPMHFNSTDSCDDNGSANYTWTFEHSGKEIHLYGPEPEFIFREIGAYEVNLTVIDREGNISYDQVKVTVENYKEKVRIATYLGIGFAGLSLLGLMVWSFILEKGKKRIESKDEK